MFGKLDGKPSMFAQQGARVDRDQTPDIEQLRGSPGPGARPIYNDIRHSRILDRHDAPSHPNGAIECEAMTHAHGVHEWPINIG